MYERYCDHEWSRDDATSAVCVKCKRRKECREGAD